MNDMTRFWRIPTPRPERPLRTAITRGFFGRCPACGRGQLFRSYLKVVNACKICGEDMSHQRADDAPAYLTLLIVAHGVGAGILLSEELWPHSSLLWVIAFWLTVTVVASTLILPRAKGAVIGQQWAMAAWLRRRKRPDVTEAARSDRALRPRDAATLILVERSERGDPRVLMGKRHAGHRFMPGKFVFPGGRVEPEDRRMAAAGALDPHVEAKLNARVRRPSPHFARALALAAIRETFEETGLAIGVPDYGAPRKSADRAPGPGSRRPASIRRSTPSTFSPARSPRRTHAALRRPLPHRRRRLRRPAGRGRLSIPRPNWSSSSGPRSIRR